MVDANEWLNEKILEDQRAQVTTLHFYRQCQSGHNRLADSYRCNYCYQNYQTSNPDHSTYKFYKTILKGELNLNSYINLQDLYIQGGSDEGGQQRLTNLKIDKCNKLTTLTITYTTLDNLNIKENSALQEVNLTYNQFGYLSLRSKTNYKELNLSHNKRILIDLDDNVLKGQVERLISTIRNVGSTSIDDLKLEAKKIEEESFKYQLAVIKDKLEYQLSYAKDKLNEENQSLLEILLESQQEVLQGGNTFARNLLEKVKKPLSNVLRAEEIQDFLGKKVEINELEIQIKNLKIQEQETSK
ncbi:14894_t:CDS:1 [Cetraspora pellucida]|uniref:14894_t:CDS:1 n=1 Tax=Cetraspora pellucida TaxID=1433469 RepID=A0A9N8ZXJ2_9GLOM|nr:14894_t:CDS:1 [Cetraspora pellucida]